jgi:hypothetical protein
MHIATGSVFKSVLGVLGFRGSSQSSARDQRTANRRSQAVGIGTRLLLPLSFDCREDCDWELLTSLTEMNCLEQVRNLCCREGPKVPPSSLECPTGAER